MVPAEAGLAVERPTVLIVEDEVLIRLMVADELRTAGLQVLEASNADEAWTILESTLPVQLLFTDIHMRGRMDGFELARLVRERYPSLKVVVTSSREPASGIRGVADAFIGKPYDLGAVVQQVQTLLTRSGHDD
jgi:CheY-like chemotaxis protein